MKIRYNRILFITQWQFEDPLVQTYTLPYVQIIQKITSCYPYVVTMSRNSHSIRIKKKGGIVSIEMPSGKRFLFMGWALNILTFRKITRKKKIQTIHPWCTTAGATGAILKLLNHSLKLIIDSFEPHAEAMVENRTWKKSGLKYKILFHFEKIESAIADCLIFAAPGMEEYIKSKYKTHVSNYFVKPACIDLEAFSEKYLNLAELVNKYNLSGKIICVYAGKFGGIYLEDETFAFIKSCETYWGKDIFKFLLLSNITDIYLKEKIAKHHIEPDTVIKLFVPHGEIPLYLGLANFAISPIKPVPTKKYCTPIKDGEYWAMGLPVVITPNISVDSEIIEQTKSGAILEGFNETVYASVIRQIDSIIKGKSKMEIYNQIRPLAEKYRNFRIAEEIYKKIYA